MKTFFAVFCAILAAAVIIFFALSAKARIDQWERAKQICYAQINSEVDAMNVRSTHAQADMHDLATRAETSSDVLEVGRRGAAALDAIQESRDRILKVEQTLVRLLENKPFGLPLTTDERKEFDSAKADVAKSAGKPNQ
jgi:hypothetical protein